MLQYGFLFCLKTCMIIHELSEMMILEELGMIIGFVIWSFLCCLIMTRRSLYERKGIFGDLTCC